MWSLLSCDFQKGLDCEKALKLLKRKTVNGSIVVFHDSVKSEKNLRRMLPPYLEFLSKEGYKVKTL
jgi:peptidoglycan/xylan/chitin deacetylase (PgdA/CDA1 family)